MVVDSYNPMIPTYIFDYNDIDKIERILVIEDKKGKISTMMIAVNAVGVRYTVDEENDVYELFCTSQSPDIIEDYYANLVYNSLADRSKEDQINITIAMLKNWGLCKVASDDVVYDIEEYINRL